MIEDGLAYRGENGYIFIADIVGTVEEPRSTYWVLAPEVLAIPDYQYSYGSTFPGGGVRGYSYEMIGYRLVYQLNPSPIAKTQTPGQKLKSLTKTDSMDRILRSVKTIEETKKGSREPAWVILLLQR
jgi:hypothetical protein